MTPTGATPAMDDSRYRLLVEAVTDYAIYMLDPDGYVASWNPGAQRFKGYAADEIIGQHFSCFYTEEDRATQLPQRALETARREGRFTAEGWRVRKDGGRFWAFVVIDPIATPGGTLLGFAKVTRDLSERREVEEALRRSEEQFRLLVQGVTDYAIYMLDPEGRVTNWNAGAQHIKGYAPGEIIGEHFSRFYTEEDRAAGLPKRGIDSALRTGSFQAEGWRVRKDGTRFWASVVIDTLRNPDGELLGFAKITRDLTQQRESALALEQAREALFHAQKLEAIGQLTGGVAHDFNNLLTPIIGALDGLSRRHEDERSQRQIGLALEAAERAQVLVARLLAFARRQALAARPVDVGGLVEGMTDLITRAIGPKVSIRLDLAPDLPAALVDPNQLEMALLNLAVNARDAMADGGDLNIVARQDVVPAGASVDLPPGDYVRLSVIDSGRGMDASTLARAVEPFFSTKDPGQGTGLGLSMVHGLAAQSGGKLVLSSTPEVGTRADIWLPTTTEPATPAAHHGPVLPAAMAPREALVLIVDDDILVRTGAAEMLRELGYTVFEAGSAALALELLRGGLAPDVLVTDYVMPAMTGLELVAAARRLQPGLPALMVTGYSSRASRGEAALEGVPYLAKPFRQTEFARRVAELLQPPREAARRPEAPAPQ